MASMADIITRQRRAEAMDDGTAGMAQAYEAVIEAAPVSINAKVAIVIPGIDEGSHSRGLAPWMPRAGAAQTTPVEGNRALVQFDERGNPWVVAWWPEGVI